MMVESIVSFHPKLQTVAFTRHSEILHQSEVGIPEARSAKVIPITGFTRPGIPERVERVITEELDIRTNVTNVSAQTGSAPYQDSWAVHKVADRI